MCKEKFSEMEFIKREYELLRIVSTVYGELPEETKQKLEVIVDEMLVNEECLKYAITVREDRFGIKQLNGPVTISYMIMELEKINSEISDRLIQNLLFKYQDDTKKVPLILTGKRVLGISYLAFLLLNTKYKIKEKYSSSICKYVIQSIEEEFDAIILTLFLTRKDISIDNKKFLIDSLDDDVLYRLTKDWEANYLNVIVNTLNIDSTKKSDEKAEKIEKETEIIHEEESSHFKDVMKIINEKLYS